MAAEFHRQAVSPIQNRKLREPMDSDSPEPASGDHKESELGLRRLWIDLREASDDLQSDLDDAPVSKADVDVGLLAETRQWQRHLDDSTIWIVAIHQSGARVPTPLTGGDFLQALDDFSQPEASVVAQEAPPLMVLGDQGNFFPCRFRKSELESHRWSLLADWPDSRQPFQLCFLAFPAPRRPVSRTVLQKSVTGPPSPADASQTASRALALESPPFPDTEAAQAQFAFHIALIGTPAEIVISTGRFPDEPTSLAVRVEFGSDRHQQVHVLLLESIAQPDHFIGSITVDPRLIRGDALRCEVRELQWDDLPALTPAQSNLAWAAGQQLIVPLLANPSSLSFECDDSYRTIVQQFPASLVGLRMARRPDNGGSGDD
jgi:hypothetical protein